MTGARPIFVLGTAFSGSRLLSWGLAQHPHLTHALETGWLVALARELEGLHALSVAEPRASRLVELATPRARFYETFGAAVSGLLLGPDSAAARRRWVDCTPGHALAVAGLLRLFPDAQVIHVVRDVRAVVKALVHWPPPEGGPYTEEAAYRHWLETTTALLEVELAFGPATVRRVPHAELVAAPLETLRACLAFLGEPFSAACQRPWTGLGAGADAEALAGYAIQTGAPVRAEAELLSDLLLQRPAPNPERMARLDAAFGQRAGRPAVARAAGGLVPRVQAAARQVLPPEAAVLVVSKGDESLLALGTRRASHFPQTETGVYAGFHPATSADAIAHLEALRAKGHDFLLIPAPYFWWLEHYQGFAAHLQRKHRLLYYQDDTCAVYGLGQPSGGWAPRRDGARRDKPPSTPSPAKPASSVRPKPSASVAGHAPGGQALRGAYTRSSGVTSGGSRSETLKTTRVVQKLWGGFSTSAIVDLEAICQSPVSAKSERIRAAWELASWHAVQGDCAATLRFLERIAEADGSKRLVKRHLLLEVDTRLRVQIYYEPQSLTWRLMRMIESPDRPVFDLVYLDAGHTWDVTGFAFFLVDKLLRPGGWLVFDDLLWAYSTSPSLKDKPHVRAMPDDFRTTPQVQKVFELLVRDHPDYPHCFIQDRWGFAQKRA